MSMALAMLMSAVSPLHISLVLMRSSNLKMMFAYALALIQLLSTWSLKLQWRNKSLLSKLLLHSNLCLLLRFQLIHHAQTTGRLRIR